MRKNETFDEAVDAALNNAALRNNFRGAMTFLQDKRRSALNDVQTFRHQQEQARQIRWRALSKLPDVLEQLEQTLSENGIQVHWAETPTEACEIIHSIVVRHGGQRIVKGKSMVSEEISLNHYLEARGIECLESDMGEYIVQLAEETPSHIIMPAIHKTKQEIARLFSQRIPGVAYTEDVDALIGIGRQVLREKFEQADVGISGVNFAIAETGTLCLVENEGNGRMCTTIPKVHIALTGIEKVVERLADLPPLLSLLTRSATGQPVTTYVNLISGPRKPDETDGPEEVHLVLLDNGRSQMYQHDTLWETLLCIRCGSCMNHCPVYSRIGGHAYGNVYPGPIGQVVAPQILGLDKKGDLTEACSLNGACGEVCPVGIPLADLIRTLREENNAPKSRLAHGPHPPGAGSGRTLTKTLVWTIWQWIYKSPGRYRRFTRWVSRCRTWLPPRIPGWTRSRSVPVPAARSLHERMAERRRTRSPRQ